MFMLFSACSLPPLESDGSPVVGESDTPCEGAVRAAACLDVLGGDLRRRAKLTLVRPLHAARTPQAPCYVIDGYTTICVRQ
jgi:hypothetical protein